MNEKIFNFDIFIGFIYKVKKISLENILHRNVIILFLPTRKILNILFFDLFDRLMLMLCLFYLF